MINVFIFRRDYRIVDNSAFNEFVENCQKEKIAGICIFVFNPEQIYAKNNKYFSDNSVQFLVESLQYLQEEGLDGKLNIYEGDDIKLLETIAKNFGDINRIYYNKDITPFATKRDARICEKFNKKDEQVVYEIADYYLCDFDAIKTNGGKGDYYKVFTPFYNNAKTKNVAKPKTVKLSSIKLETLKTSQSVSQSDMKKYYKENAKISVRGGRENGLKILRKLRRGDFAKYSKSRDNMSDENGTTRLSAYLKFGCISIREAFHAGKGNSAFQRELYWRDFYAYLVYHNPCLLQGKPMNEKNDKIKWSYSKSLFDAWKKGETGVPLVDAGMRQLNTIGWMHNRARMITAMYLTKNLKIDWRWGEKYFASRLVDYDPASNNGGWQWSSSTGADSAPYFRIMNPYTQQKRFDPKCEYINKWGYAEKEEIVDFAESRKEIIAEFKSLS